MGLNSLLHEVIKEDGQSTVSSDNGGCSDTNSNQNLDQNSDSDDDYDRKSDNAVDYSDINELADDLQLLMQSSASAAQLPGDDYDVEDAIPASKVSADEPVQQIGPTTRNSEINSQREYAF